MSDRDDRKVPYRWAWSALGLALLVRVALVWNGGQGFWPDETRYQAAQEAVRRLAAGDVRSALGRAVAEGDHPGFKLLGIVPAAVAKLTGVEDLRLPAAFFTAFSWGALLLLWGCLRRGGAPPAAQAWAVAVAALSTSLTFYTRHLLPYDAALALALGALYVGWKPEASWRRTLAAGFLAGSALLVYLGYWLVVGVVLLLIGCRQTEVWWRRLVRWLVAGAGCGAALLGVWLIDRWGEGTMIANARRFSGSVTQGDFGSGWRLVGEYFWQAEGLLAGLWVVATGWLAWRTVQHWRAGRRPDRIWLLGLLAVAVTFGGLVIFSDLLPRFVVYGRTARQLTPFLGLVTGLALAQWLAGRRWLGWLTGALLTVNFAWQIQPALTVGYPKDFRRQAAALLAQAPTTEPGQSYYRLVNVDHYVYEAEVLPYEPAVTLLAARHPYEFEPFLYEGSSARQRARRRAVDHRLRLVRMEVPPAWRVKGEAHGAVRMKVRLAPERAGFSEPLLALGGPGQGLLFFIRYLNAVDFVLGVESVGDKVLLGEPRPYRPGQECEFEFFSGAMLPEDAGGLTELQQLYYRNSLSVRCDGVEVLSAVLRPPPVRSDEIYAGYNAVGSGSAVTGFSGEIIAVERGGYPRLPVPDVEYGAVRVLAQLPAHAAGVPEPLVVAGVPGRATFGYVRILPEGKIKVGVEVWGVGAYESEPVAGGSARPVEIVFRCPAFFPPPGAGEWRDVPGEQQAAAQAAIVVTVDGVEALHVPVAPMDHVRAPVVFGQNPVGGSLVTARFTGTLLQVARLPLILP